MTHLLGYWGITSDEGVHQRLDCIVQEHGDLTECRASGAGWAIVTLINESTDRVLRIDTEGKSCGWAAGALFDRCGESCDAVAERWGEALDDQPGLAINSAVWGRFVLATTLHHGRTLLLGRDQLGLAVCYVARYRGGLVFATRLSFLVQLLGGRPSFDWEHLSSWISDGPRPVATTPLTGVRQVRPGTLLRFDDTNETEHTYWNPFEIASRPSQVPSEEQIRDMFSACVEAWANIGDRVYVDLSGGVDSSSVAWAVRDHPSVSAGYLDLHDLAGADELKYVGDVAEHLGIELQRIDGREVLPLAPSAEPDRLWDTPSPHVLQRRLAEIQNSLAGAGTVHLSGGGGDQIFLARAQKPWQLHDQLLECGPRYALRQARSYARELGTPLLALAGQVLRAEIDRALRPSAAAQRVTFTLDRPDWLVGSQSSAARSAHDLVAELAGGNSRLTSGKAHHAAEVALAAGMVDREHRNPDGPPLAYPFLSVPLVEIALQTPTSALIAAEGDRLLFRAAMSGALPDAVVRRQDKGDYTGMYQLGLRRHLQTAQDLIHDGYATQAGVIDPSKAVSDLRACALGVTDEIWPLQHLLALEMWCRAWS